MRIMLYSPDSYGLGHIRRSISIANTVLERAPHASGLIVTGAPRAHMLHYPESCDYVKLPSMTKDDDGHYVSRELQMTTENTVNFRAGMIRLSAANFKPSVLVVDHSPLGLGGEILPTLQHLEARHPETLRVLGLRDVIDEPQRVRADWRRDGVIEALDRYYDLILVYGQRDLFDPIEAYQIPESVARKMVFVGYLPRNGQHTAPPQLHTQYASRTGKLVVVALGGGGDGDVLLRSFVRGYQQLGAEPPFDVVAVTGPLMSPRKREAFKSDAQHQTGLTILEHTPEMPDLIEAADFTVSMGGYNTICELACVGARSLIVPRSNPRREQLVRARLLAERGVLNYLDETNPDPSHLMRLVIEGLSAPRPVVGWGLDFDGLQRVADQLADPGRVIRRQIPDQIAAGR